MTPIQLDFKPSKRLISLLLCFALLVCLIVMLVDLPWYWQLTLSMTVVLSAAYAIFLHGMRCLPWSVVRLTVNAKHALHLYRKDGLHFSAQVDVSTVVTPYLTILQLRNLQVTGHEKTWRLSQAVIVLPDNVDREAYRQLRVWLRWGKFKSSDQPSLP